MTTANDGRIDPALVAVLYERHAQELRLFLIGVLRDSDLAAEALQNTFTKAMESGHTARQETLKGWLFQVAFREALLIRRKSRLHDRSLRRLFESDRGEKRADAINIEQGIGRLEVVERVRQALQKLPAEQQQVVEMRIYEEMKFPMIADRLGVPLGTVLTRMRLALKKLSREVGCCADSIRGNSPSASHGNHNEQ